MYRYFKRGSEVIAAKVFKELKSKIKTDFGDFKVVDEVTVEDFEKYKAVKRNNAKHLLEDLVDDLAKYGIEVQVRNTGVRYYVVNGFYKSGTIDLRVENFDVVAYSRYDQKDVITCLEDLLHLNISWWDKSKGRHSGWDVPDSSWEPLLIEKGLVKKVVKETIEVSYV